MKIKLTLLFITVLTTTVNAGEIDHYAAANSESNVQRFENELSHNDNYQQEPFALAWTGTNDDHDNSNRKKLIHATRFTNYSPINIGAGAWFNNEKMPFGQKVISKSGWRSNKKIGRDYLTTEQLYEAVTAHCDAIFKATTGNTGKVMLNATGALALRCSGVSSSINVSIKDASGKNVLMSLNSNIFDDQNVNNGIYEYQHSFLIADFLKVIDLKKTYEPINVCVKINYNDPTGSCVVGKLPNSAELELVNNDYKRWKKHSLWYKTGFVKTNSWTHGYEVWYLSLMKKYIDYQWVGF